MKRPQSSIKSLLPVTKDRPNTAFQFQMKRPTTSFKPSTAKLKAIKETVPNQQVKQNRAIHTAKPTHAYKPRILSGGAEDDLDLVYLIMKNSPQKYDLDKLNTKFKSINKHYLKKVDFDNQMNKVDSTFYKYNLLYGSNSVNILRSYSPKMRPDSGSIRNVVREKESEQKCFTEDEMKVLFTSRCIDLSINPKPSLETKFYEYCDKKCINRTVDFSESCLSVASSEVLASILEQNEKIARLILFRNNFGDLGIENLMKGIQNNKTVVHLDISSCNLSAKGGNIVFNSLLENDCIVSLNICSKEGLNRNRLTSDGVLILEKLLKANRYLEFINLSGVNLKNEGLRIVLSGLNNNKTVTWLNVSNNEITSEGADYFRTVLIGTNKLVYLNLSENPLGNEGVTVVADCLNRQQFITLKCLEINKCKFDFVGFRNVFMHLQGNKKLEILRCNSNDLKTNDFDTVRPAFNNLNLKELSLSNCRLGNQSIKILADGMLINNTISTLVIQNNSFDDRGFASFVELPERNSTLTNFDVSKNQITDNTANQFVKNLEFNKSLKEINFFDNQLKNETGTSLIELLRKNSTLSKINLKFNGLQVRTLEEISRQLKHNRDLMKLKKIPNLRKEIRSTYVTDQDFEVTDLKIKEAAVNYQNLNEKLKEETERFELLKKDEEKKVEQVKIDNKISFEKSVGMEEQCKLLRKEIADSQNEYDLQFEVKKIEIDRLNEEIDKLNNDVKELKRVQDKKKLVWKDELMKITKENKTTSDKLIIANMSYDSMYKDLEVKLQQIEKLENPEKIEMLEIKEQTEQPGSPLKQPKMVKRGSSILKAKDLQQPTQKPKKKKTKLNTKPDAELKPRKKYELKTPNV